MKSPCKDCADREIGCHGTCEKYQYFQKHHKEEKAQISEAKLAEQEYRETRRLSRMRAISAMGTKDHYRYNRFRRNK